MSGCEVLGWLLSVRDIVDLLFQFNHFFEFGALVNPQLVPGLCLVLLFLSYV